MKFLYLFFYLTFLLSLPLLLGSTAQAAPLCDQYFKNLELKLDLNENQFKPMSVAEVQELVDQLRNSDQRHRRSSSQAALIEAEVALEVMQTSFFKFYYSWTGKLKSAELTVQALRRQVATENSARLKTENDIADMKDRLKQQRRYDTVLVQNLNKVQSIETFLKHSLILDPYGFASNFVIYPRGSQVPSRDNSFAVVEVNELNGQALIKSHIKIHARSDEVMPYFEIVDFHTGTVIDRGFESSPDYVHTNTYVHPKFLFPMGVTLSNFNSKREQSGRYHPESFNAVAAQIKTLKPTLPPVEVHKLVALQRYPRVASQMRNLLGQVEKQRAHRKKSVAPRVAQSRSAGKTSPKSRSRTQNQTPTPTPAADSLDFMFWYWLGLADSSAQSQSRASTFEPESLAVLPDKILLQASFLPAEAREELMPAFREFNESPASVFPSELEAQIQEASAQHFAGPVEADFSQYVVEANRIETARAVEAEPSFVEAVEDRYTQPDSDSWGESSHETPVDLNLGNAADTGTSVLDSIGDSVGSAVEAAGDFFSSFGD